MVSKRCYNVYFWSEESINVKMQKQIKPVWRISSANTS